MLGLVNSLRLQDELFQDGISCELDLYQLGKDREKLGDREKCQSLKNQRAILYQRMKV